MAATRIPPWVGFIVTGAALAFSVAALYFFIDNLLFIKKSAGVNGKVVEIETSEGVDSKGRHTTYYYPVFEYQTQEGNLFKVRSRTGANFSAYKIGEEVSIFYLPENPQKARVFSFFDMFFLPVFFSAFAGFLFLFRFLFKKYSSKSHAPTDHEAAFDITEPIPASSLQIQIPVNVDFLTFFIEYCKPILKSYFYIGLVLATAMVIIMFIFGKTNPGSLPDEAMVYLDVFVFMLPWFLVVIPLSVAFLIFRKVFFHPEKRFVAEYFFTDKNIEIKQSDSRVQFLWKDISHFYESDDFVFFSMGMEPQILPKSAFKRNELFALCKTAKEMLGKRTHLQSL